MPAARKAHAEPHQRSCIYIPTRQRLRVRDIAAKERVPESEVYKRLIESGLKRLDEQCEGV